MSILGRLIIIAQDTGGNSSVGCTVNIYKQGAQIKGAQAGPAYNVDSPGGLVVGDTVFAASNPATTTQVTVVTATVVTLSASLGTLADDDRLMCTSNMPIIYSDNAGTDSTANPMSTDASGVAACWIMGGYYDADFSGGTPSLTRAFQYDIYLGAESTKSNQFSGTVLKSDTMRTLAATDILLDLSNLGTNEFKVMGDGEIVAGVAGATHALTGTLTTSSSITATAGGITATAGNVQATAGDFDGRRLVMDNGTSLVNGDFALSAEWGNTATVAVTAGSKDTRGRFDVTSGGAGQAINASVALTFKDGAFGATVRAVASRRDQTAPSTGYWIVSEGTTGCTFTFTGLPVAGNVYGCSYIIVG